MNLQIKEPEQPAIAAVIWMHGLGADAQDMMGLAEALTLDYPLRHLCMNAPIRAVTINNGMKMPAWYDITGFNLSSREDKAGILETESQINSLIQQQLASGLKPWQIFLAGFSQGGAMALFSGLQCRELAGIVSLSAYLPLASDCSFQLDLKTPVFLASGAYDPVVKPLWSSSCREHLEKQGFMHISWHSYPMEHAVCMEELQDLSSWFNQQSAKIKHRLGAVS